MRRVAFINEKGGTCKTTLCVNMGAWLARARGRKVLVCDLDTQGHAGKSLGVDVRGLRPTVRDWLEGYEESRGNWVGALEVAEQGGAGNLATVRENAAAQALYGDALAQATAEATAWPYAWFTNTYFTPPSSRGTINFPCRRSLRAN